jgi:hypothetical protein
VIIQPEQPSWRFLAISQPAHSWISGQLARAWGNEVFSGFQPFEQMCYAAEQHDVGFLQWESAPTLNQATGLPHTFEDLPESAHFEIWRTGIFQLRSVCPYASLVVSLHFCHLCERIHRQEFDRDQAESQAFLKEQREFQAKVCLSLQHDPVLKGALESGVLAYHRDLIATWDLFSLELCRNRYNEFKLPQVPIWKSRNADIQVRRTDSAKNLWEVDPWPFNPQSLTAICEGKVIRGYFEDVNAMQTAVQNAEPISLQFFFEPGISGR